MINAKNRTASRILLLAGVLLGVFLLSFGLGRYAIPLTETVRILLYAAVGLCHRQWIS